MPMTSITDTFARYTPGATAEYIRTVSDADVALFALITGDQHPLHLSQEYAARTRFARRIVPAALISGVVEAALAAHVPGWRGLVECLSLEYPTLAFVEDVITVAVTVIATDVTTARLCCAILATRADGAVVARGETYLHIEDLPEVDEALDAS
jgi:3-hydroxybutyryl-CoA dehydratase